MEDFQKNITILYTFLLNNSGNILYYYHSIYYNLGIDLTPYMQNIPKSLVERIILELNQLQKSEASCNNKSLVYKLHLSSVNKEN